MLHEQRRAAIAVINALFGRPSADSVNGAGIPATATRSSVAADAGAVRFESAVLGSRASFVLSPQGDIAFAKEEEIGTSNAWVWPFAAGFRLNF